MARCRSADEHASTGFPGSPQYSWRICSPSRYSIQVGDPLKTNENWIFRFTSRARSADTSEFIIVPRLPTPKSARSRWPQSHVVRVFRLSHDSSRIDYDIFPVHRQLVRQLPVLVRLSAVTIFVNNSNIINIHQYYRSNFTRPQPICLQRLHLTN